MEIAAVDPILLNMDDEPGIKAGMMAVIPASTPPDEYPEGTLLCGGQMLDRKNYPKLAAVFHGTGGFYRFELPDLTNRFILGVNEDGEFIRGHGVVYYEDFPNTDRPSRNILDA